MQSIIYASRAVAPFDARESDPLLNPDLVHDAAAARTLLRLHSRQP